MPCVGGESWLRRPEHTDEDCLRQRSDVGAFGEWDGAKDVRAVVANEREERPNCIAEYSSLQWNVANLGSQDVCVRAGKVALSFAGRHERYRYQ